MNKLFFVAFLCVFIFLICGCSDNGPAALATANEKLESCKKELNDKYKDVGKLEERVDVDKAQLRSSYEKEFESYLTKKIEAKLEKEKEKEKSDFIRHSSIIAVIIFALFCVVVFLYFNREYSVKKSNLDLKESELNAKESELNAKVAQIERELNQKEIDLNAKIADIESQKAEMLKKIYIRDIYGKKLNEAINFLKHELNSNIDHNL